jgi:hypothetical protein
MGGSFLDTLSHGIQAFGQTGIIPQSNICNILPFLCGGHGGGGGGGTAVPEIDGPGGVAAIALLVSIGMVLYNRARS